MSTMKNLMVGLMSCLVAVGAGCGGEDNDNAACLKGERVGCSCDDDQSGLRLCQADLTLSDCLCGEALEDVLDEDGSEPFNPSPQSTDSGVSVKADSSTSTTTLPEDAKRLFVTSTRYTGRLAAYAQAGQSAAQAADELCNQSARAAELGGTWKAWLSTASVDAIDRITANGPWYALNGQRIFNNKDNLATVPLVSDITDEQGSYESLGTAIWTGTRTGGRVAEDTCNDWFSDEGYSWGLIGYLWTEDSSWTAGSVVYCAENHHLLCLEQ